LLHVFIYGKDAIRVDHRNGNTLDNRKCNLRAATVSQNAINSKLSCKNTSGVKGVSFAKASGKWRSEIIKDGVLFILGYFEDKQDAVNARYDAEIKLYGDYSPILCRNGSDAAL